MGKPAQKTTPNTGTSKASPEIVATASTEYRVKRYIMVLVLVGFGGWSLYDGYKRYPGENEQAQRENPRIEKLPHTETDILLNRAIGWSLPPLSLALLVWAFYNSRGRYRLHDNILEVPGHPPLPLNVIESIDKTDWERKGIAYLNYALPNGMVGQARLDDFIYQREPTDEIFKKIEEYTGTAEPESRGQAPSKNP